MILDTYLIIQKLKETQSSQQKAAVEQRVALEDYYNIPQTADVSTSGMILSLILTIALSIFVAYVFYNCIKTNCMSFIVFLLFIVFLNIPVLNIFAFVILIIYWIVYCRKGCKITK